MRRVTVIGTTGSGKTTFARALAQKLGVPHGEQDAWNHGPNWQMAPLAQFRAQVSLFTAGESWVMDGNYSKARDIGWARGDPAGVVERKPRDVARGAARPGFTAALVLAHALEKKERNA